MSNLELRAAEENSFDLYADGKRVGYLYWSSRTEEDPPDASEGWCAEVHGENFSKFTEPDQDIKVAVALAQALNEARAVHEAKMRRIDRNRPRTVSIPSGGQPR